MMNIRSLLLLVSITALSACVPYTGITQMTKGEYKLSHPLGTMDCTSTSNGDLKCGRPR